jgi:hypothetical protein
MHFDPLIMLDDLFRAAQRDDVQTLSKLIVYPYTPDVIVCLGLIGVFREFVS